MLGESAGFWASLFLLCLPHFVNVVALHIEPWILRHGLIAEWAGSTLAGDRRFRLFILGRFLLRQLGKQPLRGERHSSLPRWVSRRLPRSQGTGQVGTAVPLHFHGSLCGRGATDGRLWTSSRAQSLPEKLVQFRQISVKVLCACQDSSKIGHLQIYWRIISLLDINGGDTFFPVNIGPFTVRPTHDSSKTLLNTVKVIAFEFLELRRPVWHCWEQIFWPQILCLHRQLSFDIWGLVDQSLLGLYFCSLECGQKVLIIFSGGEPIFRLQMLGWRQPLNNIVLCGYFGHSFLLRSSCHLSILDVIFGFPHSQLWVFSKNVIIVCGALVPIFFLIEWLGILVLELDKRNVRYDDVLCEWVGHHGPLIVAIKFLQGRYLMKFQSCTVLVQQVGALHRSTLIFDVFSYRVWPCFRYICW